MGVRLLTLIALVWIAILVFATCCYVTSSSLKLFEGKATRIAERAGEPFRGLVLDALEFTRELVWFAFWGLLLAMVVSILVLALEALVRRDG